jgi:hypothetical protein
MTEGMWMDVEKPSWEYIGYDLHDFGVLSVFLEEMHTCSFWLGMGEMNGLDISGAKGNQKNYNFDQISSPVVLHTAND